MSCDAKICTNVCRLAEVIHCNGICGNKYHSVCGGIPRSLTPSARDYINNHFLCDTCINNISITKNIYDHLDRKCSEIKQQIDEITFKFSHTIKNNASQFEILANEHQHFATALSTLEQNMNLYQRKIREDLKSKIDCLEETMVANSNESILQKSSSEHGLYRVNPLISEIEDSAAIIRLRDNLRKDMIDIADALKNDIQKEITNHVQISTNTNNTCHKHVNLNRNLPIISEQEITNTLPQLTTIHETMSSNTGWRNLYGKRIWKADWRKHDTRSHRQTNRSNQRRNINSNYQSAHNENVSFRVRQPAYQQFSNLIYPAMLKPALRTTNFLMN